MHESGFKRWVVLGALASASWLVAGCGVLPRSGGDYAVAPGFVRESAQAGFNGTIQQLHSSIDPRTPQTAGTPGRSLAMDLGERALSEQVGRGGSGSAPLFRPGEGAAYEGLGAQGAQYDSSRQQPAAESSPGKSTEPSGAKRR
jgi:hypothetical protein